MFAVFTQPFQVHVDFLGSSGWDNWKIYRLSGVQHLQILLLTPWYILDRAKLEGTERRWAAQLAYYTYDINYLPDLSNDNADSLSRMPEAHQTNTVGP